MLNLKEVFTHKQSHSPNNIRRKVQDIAAPTEAGFSNVLRLARPTREHFPVFFRTAVALTLVWGTVIAGAVMPSDAGAPMAEAQADERAQLENELRQLEEQMSSYQKQIETYQKQGRSYQSEIGRLNAQMAKLNLQIRAVNLTLADLGVKINTTQLKIKDLESDIEKNEENLGAMLQNLYERESLSIFEVMMQNQNLSEFVNDVTHISSIQSNLYSTITQVKSLRDDLTKKKQELVIAKADAEATKQMQESQKGLVSSTKSEKDRLLAATKGQESRYQDLLKDTQKRAQEIRTRLFQFQGGGAMQFGQAYELAKTASTATGVRPAFLLAVLAHESALGKNVGQCSYTTAMRPADRPIFLSITSKLGVNPETQKVSCPNSDGPYGGAMGPAQFIPSTWKAYEARIAAIVGTTPSPWNNYHAFVAAGLYLRDAGAVTNERVAAAKYYCGGNYSRSVCLNVYAQGVLNKANSFQQDINILEGK